MRPLIYRVGSLCWKVAWRSAVVIGGLAATVVSCVVFLDRCSTAEQVVPSPDGQWVASRIVRACEAAFSSLSVSIENFVIVEDRRSMPNRRVKVLKVGGDADPEISWSNVNKLDITIQDGYEPLLSLHQAGEVGIAYHVRGIPDQKWHSSPLYQPFRRWADANVERDRPLSTPDDAR